MISEEGAIAEARARLGLGPQAPARAWRVRRVDRPGEAYHLVAFGEPMACVGVAAVDAAGGAAMIWASAPGTGPHLAIDSDDALRRCGLPPGTRAELVWRSCRGSRSPLYPLWEVGDDAGTRYVDQQGGVWASLEPSDRGGGGGGGGAG